MPLFSLNPITTKIMFEKVNPCHPDKVADRIAGAVVDLGYAKSKNRWSNESSAKLDLSTAEGRQRWAQANPKVAVEVLLGHGKAAVMIESSEDFREVEIEPIVRRLAGDVTLDLHAVRQDALLAGNQEGAVRCGDNGIFRGCAPTYEQRVLTDMAYFMYKRFPYDGKYIIEMDVEPGKSMAEMDCERLKERYKELRREEQAAETDKDKKRLRKKAKGVLHNLYALQSLGHPAFTICQSHATWQDVRDAFNDFAKSKEDYEYPLFYSQTNINPLGEWTGGIDVDCGCTNRKLGSDMGDGVTGGGLMGKDLSKADVSVNIVCYLKAVASGQVVTAMCSIGDESVTFQYADGRRETETFADIVEMARLYILTDCGGSFERFAMWGLLRP